MSKSIDTKSNFLGVNFSTASNRLKKKLLLSLLKRLGLDSCFRCGETIETPDELSIDHKDDWLGVSKDLFWDLDNIAFSHTPCNSAAGRRPNKVVCPENEVWCYKCRRCLPEVNFWKGSRQGFQTECKPCKNERYGPSHRKKV